MARNVRITWLALAFVVPVFAGCIGGDIDDTSDGPAETTAATLALLADVVVPPKVLIDDVRAGGEPVIAVTQAGSLLVSSHPGATHYHPSDDPTHVGLEFVTPLNGQSYLWRSTDGGDTWTHIGLPGMEEGPRSTGFGVSDPEFTVMDDGTVCYTDLEGLAMSSVSCSIDDGVTWTGNPVASQRPNDRQWLASHGDELYFTANYFTDHNIIVSTDRGLTWEMRGDVPCSYDLVADPASGTLVAGCPDGIAVSDDGGRTWEHRASPFEGVRRDMTEPAVDAAGNVWMAYANLTEEDKERIVVIGSPDFGRSWPYVVDLGARANLTHFAADANATAPVGSPHVWPWVSAGSEGRLAVSWIGTPDANATTSDFTDWYVYTAMLVDAHTDGPAVGFYRATDTPIHTVPICQSGTTCQVASMQNDDSGDRRLGDFFETTIDHEGNLHIVVSDTQTRNQDVVSHVAYVKMTGFPLVLPGDRLPTQG